MPNFFTENEDILFHFRNLDLNEVLEIAEEGYTQKKDFEFAPEKL